MANRDAPDDVLSQLIGLLEEVEAQQALQHAAFRNAVLNLIERSDPGFHREISSCLRSTRFPKRRRHQKSSTERTARLETALRLLQEEEVEDPSSLDIQVAAEGLVCIWKGCDGAYAEYVSSVEEDERRAGRAEPSLCPENRQTAALQEFERSERQSRVTEGWRRLTLVWIVYEVYRLAPPTASSAGVPERDIAAGERAFAKQTGLNPQKIRNIRTWSRPYVDISTRQNGLGLLLMLGTQYRNLWEHRVNSATTFWLLNFCMKREDVSRTAELLQPIACRFIERKFRDSGIDPVELQSPGHIFTVHYSSTTAFEALVEAAVLEIPSRNRRVEEQVTVALSDLESAQEVNGQTTPAGTDIPQVLDWDPSLWGPEWGGILTAFGGSDPLLLA